MDDDQRSKLVQAIIYILTAIVAAIVGFLAGCSVVKDGDRWAVDVLFPRHKIAVDVEPAKPAADPDEKPE